MVFGLYLLREPITGLPISHVELPTIEASVGPVWNEAPQELKDAIMDYFPQSEWEIAVEISKCETAGWTAFHNTNGEDSRGYFQINVARGAHPEWAQYDLFDARVNVRAAYSLWVNNGGWSRDWVHCSRALGVG